MSADTLTRHRWVRDEVSGELSTVLKNGARYLLRRNIDALNQFRSDLRIEEADLLDIASAVFGSDRLAPRPNGFKARSLNWARQLHLELPVRNPDLWNERTTIDNLRDVLEELTGDLWSFEFYYSVPAPTVSQLRFRLKPQPVALFSGGLDSLAGALDLLVHEKHPGLRLVSVSSNSHIRNVQTATFHALREKTGANLEQFQFQINHRRPTFPSGVDKTSASEHIASKRNLKEQGRRQRARAFFYFVIATILARRTQTDRIYILENGVTSLNLPINPVLSSTRVTRTTHPLVLIAFERFIRAILNWPAFRVELPYLLRTKAELVAPYAKDYRDLIEGTVSCARVLNGPLCGTCTACLLRRQVLWSVGLGELDMDEQKNRSLRDIFATFNVPGDDDRRWYFLATLDHVAELLRNPSVVASHPSVLRTAAAWSEARGLDAVTLQGDIIDLHKRYADEWRNVLCGAAGRYDSIRGLLSHDTLMSNSL